LLPLLFLAVGCRPPVEAPSDFDALNSYLYEHFKSDSEILDPGTQNLDLWLADNSEGVHEGYMVKNLTTSAILTVIPDYEEDLALVGVALSRTYTNDIRVMAHYQFWEDLENPDEKTQWLSDGDCFARQECEQVAYQREALTEFPLGIDVSTTFQSEGRWSETAHGPAFLQRRYHIKPAEVSVSWLHLLDEFALETSLPLEEGGFRMTTSSWVSVKLGDLPTPQDVLMNLGLDTLRNHMDGLQGRLDSRQAKMIDELGWTDLSPNESP